MFSFSSSSPLRGPQGHGHGVGFFDLVRFLIFGRGKVSGGERLPSEALVPSPPVSPLAAFSVGGGEGREGSRDRVAVGVSPDSPLGVAARGETASLKGKR